MTNFLTGDSSKSLTFVDEGKFTQKDAEILYNTKPLIFTAFYLATPYVFSLQLSLIYRKTKKIPEPKNMNFPSI